VSPAATTALDRAHLAFALAVHKAIAPDPAAAACWSPYSVASALGLAATGARGQTRDELTHLLLGDAHGALPDLAELLSSAAELDEPGHAEPPRLGVSNTLWTRPGLAVADTFTRELSSWPNGSVREAPFADDPEAARELINTDVRETTRGLIRELVRRGDLPSSTIATLVNALYLKTSWRQPFPERATEPRPFHAPGTTVELPTMRLSKQLGYASTGGWQVVALPAAGGVEAVVLLPDDDLRQAEPALDVALLAELLAAPVPTPVELYLPKFRVSVHSQLTSALGALGVRRLFTDSADLSGISSQRLAVSAVLHHAVLRLDEKGLEGAAATAVAMRAMMARRPMQPVVLRVDRPFLVLVRHRDSGALYFLARITGA
jgi:serine protease inhibitor